MQARKAFHARKADRMLDNFLTALKYRNDVTTDIFRRYVSVWLKKLFKVESEYQETKREKFELLQHVEDLQDCIGDLISEKEELSNSIKSLTSDKDAKEKSIKKVQKSIATKDEEISSLKDTLSSVKHELKDSREKTIELQSRVDQLEKECRLLNAELKAQKEENKRISSLTWYQKLLGKK
jgi:chromosome segregation ATPase